jgi:creatinine amidohydrolase
MRKGNPNSLLIQNHAGNSHMVALRLAAQDVVIENEGAGEEDKVRIMVLSDFDFAEELTPEYADENDGHAGTLETSRMLALSLI